MKFCIYSPSERIWGGGQIYIENLCRYLNSQGTSAKIMTSEPESFSCPTITMASVSRKSDRLKGAFTAAKFLKSEGASVVVLNDLSSLWLAPIFRFYGLKVVSLLHLYLQKRNATGLGHAWLEYHLLRTGSRFTHHVFSVNKDNQNNLPVPVEFIGNFISPWFFKGVGQVGKIYDIGLISRLSLEKNIPLFIQVVANLGAFAGRPMKALIVGKGPEEARIRAKIEQVGMEDQIDIMPWVERDDLPAIYDQLKCFAITSHHEGFATTLLEAHARGVPAISTRTAGYCGEFIAGEGEPTGLVFDSSEVNSDQFLRSVLGVIEESKAYAELCREKAMRYSEERVLGRIQEVLNVLSASEISSARK